jgi:exopolysaccharide biosynthesis protein
MFKRLFFLVLAIIAGLIIWLNFFDGSEENLQDKLGKTISTPFTPDDKEVADLKIDEKKFRVVWFKADDVNDLLLVENFEGELTLDQIIEKYDCKDVSNGGFYQEDGSPIGLFITEGKVLNNASVNRLFNGYFSVTKSGDVTIASNYPSESLRIGLQTGPLLVKSGVIQRLNLESDKSARRVVVALTEEEKIYFITIFDKESVFQGPLLANLPTIVKEAEKEIGVKFMDAINLDGGTASAFYTKDRKLSELTSVGSFFCLK